ncbi:MAG: YbhB/YbcL family Raf kinase inhibitor-like protein [Polyangiaceae bacterium]
MPELHRESQTKNSIATLELTSPAFADGTRIPKRYTADGEDLSPPLEWSAPPSGTKSIAVICEDPDAPSGIFFHWTAWSIAPKTRRFNEGVSPDDVEIRQGENGFCKHGYGGPKPPPGPAHRYVFKIIALDSRVDLPAGATRRDFDTAIENHVIGCGTLVGVYSRGEMKS